MEKYNQEDDALAERGELVDRVNSIEQPAEVQR